MADGAALDRWYTAAELAGLPGLPGTERGINKAGEREGWARRQREQGKGWQYSFRALPSQAQAAILLRERPHQVIPRQAATPKGDAQIRSAWQRYDAVKQGQKDKAATRLKALQAVGALVKAGTPLMQAREVVADRLIDEGVEVSAASIARWQASVDGVDIKDWLAMLVPHYAGRTSTAQIEPQAWEIFKADYLRLEQPTASSCYDRLVRIANARGWTLPSLKTFTRRIERELPRAVRLLARQGEDALMRSYPAQERDRSMFTALEAVNADGHRWDVRVRFPDGSEGRPCIVGWQDLYSGRILAWRLCDHESSDVVRLSFGDMLRNYGVPGSVYLDNGRAFASKWMTGGTPTRYRFKVREEDPAGLITALVGEDNVHWVTPYHGQAKPIERAWLDFCERISKHPAFAGAYVGNSVVNKPENYGSRVIEWDVFERTVNSEIHEHNARHGRRSKVCNGRSFNQVFDESFAKIAVRRVSEEQLRLLLLAAEAVTASALDGSVRLAGNRYWAEALSEHAGRKVVLRVDPWHLQGEAHVYALDGTFITSAPCTMAVGFADVNAAREHSRGRKQYRKAAKAMLDAERLMDAAQVAAQLPPTSAPTPPIAGIVAPVFGLHGKKPEPRSERFAATGTEGPSALDLLMFQQAKQRKENEI
ncbi:transposase InsO family protein [Dyella sp. SG562]|uniref:transposase domain-containing protein n=1 Tax=Dyella sp. SG562 TaxID=2587017 RepID=UPI0014242AB9|nr:transposase domain-containing protein [Dyella sp. SG562]NII74244.1 transposase InsO family protein [Dyella sp. SG562]